MPAARPTRPTTHGRSPAPEGSDQRWVHSRRLWTEVAAARNQIVEDDARGADVAHAPPRITLEAAVQHTANCLRGSGRK